MNKIVQYAKSRPWVLGVGVVVIGLILFTVIGGGSSEASSSSTGVSDAQLAAEAQVQAAQISAQAQAAAASSNAQLQLQLAQIGAATASETARLEAAVAEKTLAVQESTSLAQIAADKETNIANINAQASVANTQTNAQLSAVKSNNKTSVIGSIAKLGVGVLKLFSDERLKKNIRKIGVHENGYGIYEYEYIFGSGRQVGVMAQEIMNIYPEAVSIHASGFYMVDYGRIGFG